MLNYNRNESEEPLPEIPFEFADPDKDWDLVYAFDWVKAACIIKSTRPLEAWAGYPCEWEDHSWPIWSEIGPHIFQVAYLTSVKDKPHLRIGEEYIPCYVLIRRSEASDTYKCWSEEGLNSFK